MLEQMWNMSEVKVGSDTEDEPCDHTRIIDAREERCLRVGGKSTFTPAEEPLHVWKMEAGDATWWMVEVMSVGRKRELDEIRSFGLFGFVVALQERRGFEPSKHVIVGT
jgi:hypothetical protein